MDTPDSLFEILQRESPAFTKYILLSVLFLEVDWPGLTTKSAVGLREYIVKRCHQFFNLGHQRERRI